MKETTVDLKLVHRGAVVAANAPKQRIPTCHRPFDDASGKLGSWSCGAMSTRYRSKNDGNLLITAHFQASSWEDRRVPTGSVLSLTVVHECPEKAFCWTQGLVLRRHLGINHDVS